MKNLLKISTIALFAIFALSNCQKRNNSGSMTVKMTDAPGDFQEVNVEVVALEIHYEKDVNGEERWVSLAVNQGVYDLLELQNNITAVLVDEDGLPVGKVTQMRLILGDANSVVVDNIQYGLKLSSQDETGLKINIDGRVKPHRTMEVVIDFDAGKSIVQEGTGAYRLKPVLEVKSLIYI